MTDADALIIVISISIIVLYAIYRNNVNEKEKQYLKNLNDNYHRGYKAGTQFAIEEAEDYIRKVNDKEKRKALQEIDLERRKIRNELEIEKKKVYADIDMGKKRASEDIENDKLRSEKEISLRIQKADYTAEQILTEAQNEIAQIRADLDYKNSLAAFKSEANRKESEKLAIIRNVLIKKDAEINEKANDFEKIFQEKTRGFPWLADKLAEFYIAKDLALSEALATKRNPAIKAAAEVKRLAREKKELLKQLRVFEYQLEYYESLFPWLTEYREIPDHVIINADKIEEGEEKDPALAYFTPSESQTLTKAELFQKALERYVARRKSNWEIGRDYERYIGYQYEINGYDVQYFGATKGLEDMGRDLIAQDNKGIHIVQCKYWSKDKTIHEKHIFQLFGTAVMYAISKVGMHEMGAFATLAMAKVKPVFVCTCNLSDTARSMAQALGVIIREECSFDPDYPRIKCNVGKDKEMIYHLPFDQMYDRIKIEPHKNEYYVRTVAEAEQKGFRRAWRWRGN